MVRKAAVTRDRYGIGSLSGREESMEAHPSRNLRTQMRLNS